MSGTRLKSFLFVLVVAFCFGPGSELAAQPMKFPWAGGMNSCQFCEIDLNLDGKNDLLVFDRHGNRKLPFVNGGTPGATDYTLVPSLSARLPELHDWVITADYNCDGKMDLFTYGLGGARVFRNISDTALKFILVTDMLESYYYSGYIGILITSVDYPAIADVDGDGDLDLLSFFGLGSYVEYHRNLSMEKYGHCDSLDFRLSDHCWGRFKESEGSNVLTLNAPCPYTAEMPGGDQSPKHTGSTMLLLDLNGDHLQDLLLGDVDFPNLIALTNGGTPDSAFMVSQDTLFPSGTRANRLFDFPAAVHTDLDNDGVKDLLITSFEPGMTVADNYHCAWFYKNTGTNALPRFEFVTDRFFRNEMMDFGSNAFPVLYDFDRDGLDDLFVGNLGYYDSSYYYQGYLRSDFTSGIAFFRNEGSLTAPVFRFVTGDLAGLSLLRLLNLYPSFSDLNGDGLTDLLAGCEDGTLIFCANAGGSGVIPAFGSPQIGYQQIDVGDFSTPQLFDLDRDGLPDLVTGEKKGNLNYFRNTGTATIPQFSPETDSLGKVNVTNYAISYNGYSTPWFFRLPAGETRLLCGSEEGRLYYFTNIDNNLGGRFTPSSELFSTIGVIPEDTVYGWRTGATLSHLSDPERFDLLIGNYSGGLNYFSAGGQAIIIPGIGSSPQSGAGALRIHPNPASDAVEIRWSDNTAGALPTHIAPGEQLQFMDVFGRTVLTIPFSQQSVVSTASLPNGIYFIRCGRATGKLVIRH